MNQILLLPAAARHWSGAQLHSVLLHELAHIKRRDTLVQLVAQFACALYWFNPCVWFAAWRLGVERERACDDLVLASGVRPSAYAGHLLEVVTELSPARWTAACGLAMARKSSLEGRLLAVLGGSRNRRGVTRILAAAFVVLAAAIAVPLAMLRAAQPDKPNAAPAAMNAAPKQVKPGQVAKLQPGTEEKLEWSEPVNGLRASLVWPPSLGEPAAGEIPDFYLAVQNVSQAPVRLCTTADAPMERRLDIIIDDATQAQIVDNEPNGADVTLGPREVVFLRVFTASAKDPNAIPVGSGIASDVRRDPSMTLRAEMVSQQAPTGAWTGTLLTPKTRAGVGAEAPKNRKARELFKVWLGEARVNGKIPGGFVARLGEIVQEFVLANTGDKSGDPYAKRMEPLLPRLDGSRDWQPAEASAVLNDIAIVSDAPLSVMLEEIAGGEIQDGLPLKNLDDAPWGEGLPNGLRVACLVEPRAAEHRLGTPLLMRIFVYNAGQEPVVFRTRKWHHIEPAARDAQGEDLTVDSVTLYTRSPLVVYRLAPGRFVELASPGIGVGRHYFHDWHGANVASWVEAQEGDEVTLTPGLVPLSAWNEVPARDDEPRWWLDFLTARLNLANPLPADAAERTQLLERTVRDMFHTEATAEEIAAFVADGEPNALESLAKRLAGRSDLRPFSGSLQSGPTAFRVLPADPDAARTSSAPAATAGE